MKKILIPNATSPSNIGDLAMLTALLMLINKSYRGAHITIHSTDPSKYRKNFTYRINHTLYSWSVFSSKNALVTIGRLLQIFVRFIEIKYKKSFPFVKKNSLLNNLISDYMNADIIILAPGGYIHTKPAITQTLNLCMQLVMFEFAKLSTAKKIIAPISFGPFSYMWQEELAAYSLRGFDIVATRESRSYAILRKYKLQNLTKSSDLALLLKKRMQRKIQQKNNVVGFTIRDWLSSKKQQDFENSFIQALTKFSRKTNVIVQPIIQVHAPKYHEDDVVVTDRIVKKLKSNNVFVQDSKKIQTLSDAAKAYGSLDLLIGMRMHSNILAAVEETPFVAISYEHKTDGITKHMGMGNFCIACKKVNSTNLYKLMTDAYKQRRSIRKNLRNTLTALENRESNKWTNILRSPAN